MKWAEFYQNFILSIKLQDIQLKSDLKVKTSLRYDNKQYGCLEAQHIV